MEYLIREKFTLQRHLQCPDKMVFLLAPLIVPTLTFCREPTPGALCRVASDMLSDEKNHVPLLSSLQLWEIIEFETKSDLFI